MFSSNKQNKQTNGMQWNILECFIYTRGLSFFSFSLFFLKSSLSLPTKLGIARRHEANIKHLEAKKITLKVDVP